MPEGPEVETVRRSLLPLLLGATLARPRVSAQKLRTPITRRDLKEVDGAVVVELFRKGKVLGIRNDRGAGILVRLGMTGRLLVELCTQRPAPHTHVRFDVIGAAGQTGTELRFVDPRRFGEVVPFASDVDVARALDRLGPDGLALNDEGRACVISRLKATSRAIKDVLLDQSVVAGVGNIYAAEACFVARLSPFRAGSSLDDDEALALVGAIESVLHQGVKNRGTSFSDYVDGAGNTGDNAVHLQVFQRQGQQCRVCAEVVVRVLQGQRSTFWCPRCQK